jgi:acyl-CoA thioester hydrolase
MAISKPLEFEHQVTPAEIDELGHVNNQVYLDWLMGAATRHSKAVGWDLPRLIEMGQGWVVRRHEIDYLLPVMPGETVLMRTWVETAEKASSDRYYEIFRKSDGKKVCGGRTMWVWINYKTGRPARIPQEVINDFANWDPARVQA